MKAKAGWMIFQPAFILEPMESPVEMVAYQKTPL